MSLPLPGTPSARRLLKQPDLESQFLPSPTYDNGESPGQHLQLQHPRTLVQRLKLRVKQPLAEFLGTCILILMGVGGGLQFGLDHTGGDHYFEIWTLWGLGVMCAVYISGDVSGGHVNPAVTISLALYGKFPWRKVPGYVLGQILGAFTAAVLLFLFYLPEIHLKDADLTMTTASMFFVTPPPYRTKFAEVISEGLASALLILMVFAIGEPKNGMKPDKGFTAVAIGLAVTGIGASLGSSGGYSLNPARDIGPRLFTAIVGYGEQVFSYSGYYFWIPWLVPILGGMLGSTVHQVLISHDE